MAKKAAAGAGSPTDAAVERLGSPAWRQIACQAPDRLPGTRPATSACRTLEKTKEKTKLGAAGDLAPG
jgi:hypothetical protein